MSQRHAGWPAAKVTDKVHVYIYYYFFKKSTAVFQVGPNHLGAQTALPKGGRQAPVSEPQKGRDNLIALTAN